MRFLFAHGDTSTLATPLGGLDFLLDETRSGDSEAKGV